MKAFVTILFMLLLYSNSSIRAQILQVPQNIQEHDQWCWAGVSKTILDYYCTPTNQCDIAEYCRNVATWHNFGNANCCQNPNVGCNYWNYNWGYAGSIQNILEHFANISNYGVGNYLSQSTITSDLQNNRLFVIRWGWTTGGGHFVVGHGKNGNNIYYMDPWFGEGLKIATYSWMVNGGGHNWTHTNRLSSSPNSSSPEKPDDIIGEDTVCLGEQNLTYHAANTAGASSFLWTLPPGATGNSTGSSIIVDFDSTVTAGNLTVKGVNGCGAGEPFHKMVVKRHKPDSAGDIIGIDTICQGDGPVEYNLAPIAGANSYTWSLPYGSSGNSSSETIQVNYGLAAQSGYIEVEGQNNCGTGASSSLSITANETPSTPTITLAADTLVSNAQIGNQWYNENGAVVGATNQHLIVSNFIHEYFTIVTVDNCPSDTSNRIDLTELNGVGESNVNAALKLYPNPVSNNLKIETEKNVELNVQIFSSAGQLVHSSSFNRSISINTRGYQSGLYFILIEGNMISYKEKLLVN